MKMSAATYNKDIETPKSVLRYSGDFFSGDVMPGVKRHTKTV